MTAVIERKTDRAPKEAKASEGQRASSKQESKNPGRRCLACGELKNREELIRFVIGPDRQVVPDLSENLPGHGMWVSANAADITLAAKKNLFAKAAKTPAKPAADLAAQTAALMRARCLNLLGLAKGAGSTILGEGQAEAAMRAGKPALYLVAADAAKLLDNRHDVPVCQTFTRDELGAALGYAQIVHAALLPHGLTTKLKLELNRLDALTSSEETKERE